MIARNVGVAAFLTVGACGDGHDAVIATAAANDNRVPGGALVRDTLRVQLVATIARWFPEADSGPYLDVATFAEEGHPR